MVYMPPHHMARLLADISRQSRWEGGLSPRKSARFGAPTTTVGRSYVSRNPEIFPLYVRRGLSSTASVAKDIVRSISRVKDPP